MSALPPIPRRKGVSLNRSARRRWALLLAAVFGPVVSLRAATYFAISDDELIRRTPVVVRATAGPSRVVEVGGHRTETRTTFAVARAVRGSAEASIEVALPGGTLASGAGSYAWMPEIPSGDDDVLFLYRRPDGVYGISELELGIFEVQYDSSGTAFAVRPRFQAGAIRALGVSPGAASPPESPRELASFLAKIAGGPGDPGSAPAGALPAGLVPIGGAAIRPMWNNLNSTRVRWSSGAAVSVGYVDEDASDSPGPQARVSGGGLAELQGAAALWSNDSSSDIGLAFAGAGSRTITIHTDETSQFGGSGIPCSLGVVGLTSVAWSSPNQTYKGESYRTLLGADVYLRRWDCTTSSYLNSAFENVATHELGHSIGLDHPDQATSPHDRTPGDVAGAVMISLGSYTRPVGLGSDDVEGICYLYGACTDATPPPPPPPTGSAPVASFVYSPSAPAPGKTISFSDTSTGSPTLWTWNFGDPASGLANASNLENPTHAYGAAGNYVVQLTAASSSGSSSAFRTLTVASTSTTGCQTDSNTLCLQTGRFRVRVSWHALHLGTSGNGIAIPLTADSGAFWFFNSTNFELVVKVLDGRTINGHFWVFYGALSDVQYTITVTDTATGAVRTYTNPQDTLASRADTEAF